MPDLPDMDLVDGRSRTQAAVQLLGVDAGVGQGNSL